LPLSPKGGRFLSLQNYSLLNKEQGVEGCDATMLHSSAIAGFTII